MQIIYPRSSSLRCTKPSHRWLCHRVPLHEGISIVFSLFRSPCLAEMYCLIFWIGSCVKVHEDKTPPFVYSVRVVFTCDTEYFVRKVFVHLFNVPVLKLDVTKVELPAIVLSLSPDNISYLHTCRPAWAAVYPPWHATLTLLRHSKCTTRPYRKLLTSTLAKSIPKNPRKFTFVVSLADTSNLVGGHFVSSVSCSHSLTCVSI